MGPVAPHQSVSASRPGWRTRSGFFKEMAVTVSNAPVR
jgi:hypothetical protein